MTRKPLGRFKAEKDQQQEVRGLSHFFEPILDVFTIWLSEKSKVRRKVPSIFPAIAGSDGHSGPLDFFST